MIQEILQELEPFGARLVAVSKTKPIDQILEIYHQGQRIFGENRVQELMDKKDKLPSDIEWHLIGHLQRNKVKYIAPFIRMIHSVDSIDLAKEIDKQAEKCSRRIPVLLQIRIAEEETKFGIEPQKVDQFVGDLLSLNLDHLKISGVMGMASFVEDEDQVAAEFHLLKEIFNRIKADYFIGSPDFCELSMGMSGDYQIALRQGSTLVRIGSLLFGSRN